MLQADLIDFSQNARSTLGNKYALLLADVYTRELKAVPLSSKNPSEVNPALQEALGQMLPEGKTDFVLSTDKGGEFARIDSVLPDEAVHRVKEGINDIAVVDRGTQTIKKDMAAIVARKGGRWDEAL